MNVFFCVCIQAVKNFILKHDNSCYFCVTLTCYRLIVWILAKSPWWLGMVWSLVPWPSSLHCSLPLSQGSALWQLILSYLAISFESQYSITNSYIVIIFEYVSLIPSSSLSSSSLRKIYYTIICVHTTAYKVLQYHSFSRRQDGCSTGEETEIRDTIDLSTTP